MRIDKFLKVSRIIKRRTVAQEACDAGRVFINGRQAKPGSEVRQGDTVVIAFGNHTLRLQVQEARESATVEQARQMYKVVDETIHGISS